MPAGGGHNNDALKMQEHAAQNAFDKVGDREQTGSIRKQIHVSCQVPGTTLVVNIRDAEYFPGILKITYIYDKYLPGAAYRVAVPLACVQLTIVLIALL